MSQAAAPFNDEIAQLEAQKKTFLEDLPEESKRSVQEAEDNYQAALMKRDALYERAKFLCEPSPKWYERLFLPRRRRMRKRDKTHGG